MLSRIARRVSPADVRALRQVGINNGMLIAQYAVASGTPLLLIPHIVRTIGVGTYGAIAVALAWGKIGAVVVAYAFQLTGPKRVAQCGPDESAGTIFAEVFLAKMFLLALMLLLLGGVVWFSEGHSTGVSTLVLFALPLAAALNSSWFLLARDRVGLLSGSAICGSIISLSIGFSFVRGANTASAWGAAWAMVASPLFAGVATLIVSSTLARGTGVRWRHVRPKRALSEGLPLFASQFVAAIYTSVGPIVINRLAGVAEAGIYSVVERIVNAVVGGSLLTHTAAYPRLAGAYVKDKPAYWRLLKLVVAAYVAIAVTVSLTVWLFRDFVLHLLFGGAATASSSLLAWALIWLILGIMGPAVTGYLTVSGRGRDVAVLTLKVLVASFVLGVPGVLEFGGAGWMAALVISQIFVVLAIYRNWRREHVLAEARR